MTWLVKSYDGEYLTESAHGSASFSEKQWHAKRFGDQGRAYRTAMRWDGMGMRVVRLLKRNRHLLGNVTSYSATATANYEAGTCNGELQERAAIVAYLRRYKYPTCPSTWADLIEKREHLKDAVAERHSVSEKGK